MKAQRAAGLVATVCRRSYSTAPFDREAYLLRTKSLLQPGRQTRIFDILSPMSSHLLNTALATHIPPEVHQPPEFRALLSEHDVKREHSRDVHLTHAPVMSASPLPLGHHLVYFGPQNFSAELMPDGTVADHCPGPPFTRRMWAGGTVKFPLRELGPDGRERASSLKTGRDGEAVCVEQVVGDPVIKGVEGEEKVFVELSRKYVGILGNATNTNLLPKAANEHPDIEERRTLVFMRERAEKTAREADKDNNSSGSKARDMTRLKRLKDKNWTPSYSFSLTPDRNLLFQFSALSFNAHAIHLDQRYAQEVERHRDCLVHGPLSLSLMLMAVQAQADRALKVADRGVRLRLMQLDYRNLAPLYVGEAMKVCVRIGDDGVPAAEEERTWDVWVEGPDGGFAVKGTAVMRGVSDAPASKLSDEPVEGEV